MSIALIASALALGTALRTEVPECTPPTGLSAPMRDFNPEVASPEKLVAEYTACLTRQGEAARLDPIGALRLREADNSTANFIIAVGKAGLGRLGLGPMTSLVNITISSSRLSDQIKAGIQDKYSAFKTSYDLAMNGSAVTGTSVRAVMTNWAALRAELVKAADSPTIRPDEKALVQKRIQDGDLLEKLAMVRLFETRAANPSAARAEASAAGITPEQITAAVEEAIARMAQPTEIAGPSKSELAAAQAQRITDYAALSQSLIGVGERLGFISGSDAQTMNRVVSGVSQISAAAVLIEGGASTAGASMAGPYAMGINGALVLASAFDRPRADATTAMMSMLAAISKQITHLQETVERGFEQIADQQVKSEIRIMARLDQVLANDARLDAQISTVSTDLARFRDELLEARYAANRDRAAAFVRNVTYDDARCLREFKFWQHGDREQCLDNYASLVRDFYVSQNAALVGEHVDLLDRRLGVENKTAALIAEYNAVAPRPRALVAVHRPTLDLLTTRVKLFLQYNPGLGDDAAVKEMVKRLADFEAAADEMRAAFTSPEFVDQVWAEYTTLLSRYLTELDARAAHYAAQSMVSVSDSVSLAEGQIQNEATAMTRRADAFRPGNASLVARITGARDDIDYLRFGGDSIDFKSPSRHISEKLDNYAIVASHKDRPQTGVFPDRLTGYHWVLPCEWPSPYPAIPFSREMLGSVLPMSVVAATAASRSAVTICYGVNANKPSDFVSIGNTYAGMNVVRARINAAGFKPGVIHGYPHPFHGNSFLVWCRQARRYFATQYMIYREYTASAFEECHDGDHIHHKLYTNADLISSMMVTVRLNLSGYRAGVKSFTRPVPYVNDALSHCFLPYDRNGTKTKTTVLMPFLQEYPSPLTKACPGADDQIIAGLRGMSAEIDQFLTKDSTRFELQVGAPAVSYGDALGTVVANASERNFGALDSAIFANAPGSAQLDRLQVLLSGIAYHAAEGIDALGDRRPLTSAQLRDYIALLIRDTDGHTLRMPSTLRPEGTMSKP